MPRHWPSLLKYHRYVMDRLEPSLGRRVWEVGSGDGEYTRMLLQDGREVLASDTDPKRTAALQRLANESDGKLSTLGIDPAHPDSLKACFAWRPDTILSIGFVSRLEDDARFLSALRSRTPEKVSLVLCAPANPSLFGFMDEQAGHRRRYTREGLSELVSSAGWTVRDSFYIDPIGGLGWLVRTKLLPPRSRSIDDPSIRRDAALFDRHLVPLTRRLDGLFSKRFGLSMVVFAS